MRSIKNLTKNNGNNRTAGEHRRPIGREKIDIVTRCSSDQELVGETKISLATRSGDFAANTMATDPPLELPKMSARITTMEFINSETWLAIPDKAASTSARSE